MNLITIDFSRQTRVPLYQQIYNFLASEIISGKIRSGEKLPGKKSLAVHLSVSVNTVETGYGLLMQEGYIYSKPRSGYYVSELDGLIKTSAPQVRQRTAVKSAEYKYDFRTNAVDTHSFPYRTWARLSRETLMEGQDLLTAGDTRGDYELRETLVKYLHEFRGVNCTPEQVVIGAGVEYLLTLLSQLLSPLKSYAVENPGYTKSASALKNGGCKISYIPMDGEGMIPDALRSSGAELCCLTPSHQFPTGIVMPVGRRYQLLNWAAEDNGRYIIEDDYNSEFTFSGKPIPAMQGIDDSGTVIYISTFSRTLAPSIRIAYMVLPENLSREFDIRFKGYASTVSRFEQHTLMRFISGGYLGRHLNRVKNIYKKRRDYLIKKLGTYPFAGEIKISGGHAGLHLLVSLDKKTAELVSDSAQRENIRLYRLSDYYYGTPNGHHTLIMGFSGMDEEDLDNAVGCLFAGL